MYLKGKRYISKHFNEGDDAVAEAIQKLFPELKGKTGRWGDASPISEVSIDLGYWRKVNAVHKWFVDNVQGGVDDCGHYYVDREQLRDLRDLCQRVIDFKHLANDQLPVQSGFLFGSTEYDDHYYQGLERTIKIIDDALALPESWDFEYHSSW